LALYRVDWSDPTLYYRAFTGELGEIRYGDQGFEADVSGLSARLEPHHRAGVSRANATPSWAMRAAGSIWTLRGAG
jgi:hypothetical protein